MMQNSPQTKRTAIVRAAHRLFIDHGYEASGVKEIAAHAQVSLATFYRYFDSKQTLLREVAIPRLAVLVETVLRTAAIDGSAVERLARCFRAACRLLDEDPLLSSVVAHRNLSRELEAEWERVHRLFERLGVAILERARDRGELDISDPVATMALLRCLAQGWFLSEVHRGGAVEMERILDVLESMMRTTLATERSYRDDRAFGDVTPAHH